MKHIFTIAILIAFLLALATPQCLSHYDYFNFNTGSCLPCGPHCLSCFDSVVCMQCVPQYFTNNNQCSKCPFGCSVCSSATSCSTCNDGLYLTNTGTCSTCSTGVATCTLATIQTCQVGYFMLGTICAGCFTNCKTCSDFVTCSTCNIAYYLGPSGNSCLACPTNCRVCTSSTSCIECDLGYTQSGSGCSLFACSAVNPFCKSCANGQCLSCQTGTYLSGGTCLQGASLLCLESTGAYYTNCVTSSYGCQTYSSIQTQNNNQMPVCLPLFATKLNQYIYQTPTYTCTGSCSTPNILTISYSTAKTYYQITFHLRTRLYSSTTARVITVSLVDQNGSSLTSSTINADISSQLTTFAQSDASCLSCPFGQKILTGTLVLSAGQYPTNFTLTDTSGMIQVVEAQFEHAICQIQYCSHCTSAVDCTACFSPYFLQLTTCVSSCDSGFYLYGRTCYLTCPSGTYTQSSDYSCQLCTSPCATCISTTSCLSCASGFFLEGTSCLTSCSNTTIFPNSTSLTCQTCPNPCTTCQITNNTITCLSCAAGYLQSSGSCIYICPSGEFGFFLNSTSQCQVCSSACTSCFLASSTCSACSSGYLLLDSTCNNLTSCPTAYYIDTSLNRCLQCHYPCSSCVSTASNCTSCSRGILHNNLCLNACPDTFYPDYTQSQNVSCQPCQSNCLHCQTASSCLACSSGLYLSVGSCSGSCPSGSFPDTSNNSCTACIPPCKTCSSSTSCSSCTSGYLDVSTCTLSCNSSSYINTNFICTLCVSPCISCHSTTSCLSCSLPHMLYSGSCITEASCLTISGYYPDYSPNSTAATSGQCSACLFPCATCTSTSVTCTSCVSGYLMVPQTSKCLSQCPDSYYSNNTHCLLCDSNCYLCTSTSVQCTSCPSGQYLTSTSTCIATCPNSYYGNDQNQQCVSCVSPCANCYNLYLCSSCTTGILYNKQCVTTCPASTYLNSSINSCVSCTNSCLTCSGTASTCTTCSNGYFLNNASCLTSCPSTYFGNQYSHLCEACTSPCADCTSSSSCTSCLSGYFYSNSQCLTSCATSYYADNSTNQCVSCNLTICLTCSLSSNNCLTCNLNFYMHNSSCISTCPSGYYSNPSSGTCDACPFPCASCSNYTFCSSCLTSYYLFSNRCFSQCPVNYYPDNASLCQSCSINCQTCSSATICLHCDTNYYLLNSNCISSCSLGMFPGTQAITNYDQCQVCKTDCVNCTAYDYCVQCTSSLIQFNGLCLSTCPIFYYPFNGTVCQLCGSYCTTCTNATYCTNCIGTYLHNNICVVNCPAQTYPYQATSCLPCISPCSNCTGNFTCTTCLTGYIYFHNYCVTSCPSGTWFYPNNNTCNANCPYNKYQATLTCYVGACGTTMVALNGYCLSECSSNYYVNNNQECISCDSDGSLCGKSLFKGDLQIVYSEVLTLVLYFNQQAELVNIQDISIQFIDIDANTVSYALLNQTLTQYSLTFLFDRTAVSLVNITLTIPYLQSQTSQQKLSTNIFKKQLPTYLNYSQQTSPSSIKFIPIILFALLLVVIIFNICNKSSRFVQLLDYFQLIAVTLYLDVQYPPLLEQFLSGFRIALFALTKNMIDSTPYTFSPPKFIFYHTDTLLLRNLTPLFLIFLGFIVTFVTLIIIHTCKPNYLKKAVRWIRYRLLNDLFSISMTPLFLFVCQFNNQTPGAMSLSIMLFLLGIFYVGWISYKIISVKKLSDLSGLLGDFQKTQNKIGLMYIPFSYIRRIIFTIGLGIAPYEPIATVTLLLVLTFLIMICIYFYQPFDNLYTDYVTIFMESSLTLYIICLIILGLNVMDTTNNHNLAAFCVGLITLTVVLCMIWLVYLTFQDIKTKGFCPALKEEQTGGKDDYSEKKYDQDEEQLRKMEGLQPLKKGGDERQGGDGREEEKDSAQGLLNRGLSDEMLSKADGTEQFRHWSEQNSSSNGEAPIRQSKLPHLMIKVNHNEKQPEQY